MNWNKERLIAVEGLGNMTIIFKTPMACCAFTGTFPSLGEPKDKQCMTKLDATVNNYDKVIVDRYS